METVANPCAEDGFSPADMHLVGEALERYPDLRMRYEEFDPEQKWAEICRLTSAGTYETASDRSSGLLKSEVFPGLWLRTEWLLDEPTPGIDTVLREWGLRGAAA